MGYNVIYENGFKLNKKVSKDFVDIIQKFSETRHYRRNIVGYGLEGEFFLDPDDNMYSKATNARVSKKYNTLNYDDFQKIIFEKYNIIDYNASPLTQPGLWCQWIVAPGREEIVWDQNEKFYHGPEWLQYLIDFFIIPYGYNIKNGESTRFFDESYDHSDERYIDKDPKWTKNTTQFWNGILTVNNNIVSVEHRT